jgi:4'-phosphopantetheinyl transferase N-terminal domain
MATSKTFSVEHRRLRPRQESTLFHAAFTSLVVMTLLSTTVVRGMVLSSRARHYRLSHRTSFLGRQNALSSEVSYGTTAPSLTQELSTRKPWTTLFDLELPEGRCVGLQIDNTLQPLEADALSSESISSPDHWIHAGLHPAEVAYGMSQPSDVARTTFFLGRLAMRQILNVPCCILKDDHGRPTLPPEYLGSISHKRNTGVALICKTLDTSTGIGVDIEKSASGRRSIAKRVLTERELDELGHIEVSMV